MGENGIVGIVFAALTSAIAWLAKRLYDSPRPSDYAAIVAERNELRVIVNAATDEAKRLLVEREAENRKLRDEIADLHATVLRVSGGTDGQRRPVP